MRTALLAVTAFALAVCAESLGQLDSSNVHALDTLYFITNDPKGNHVVAASIGSNGDLTYAGATATGGAGTHGIGAGTADATFSQGIVQVHQDKGLLATVNTLNHTVVVFEIDSLDPRRLKMLGKPVYSGGTSPNSVAFNKAGDSLCVLNTGSINGVACFDITKGGLYAPEDSVRKLGLQQTTPATGPFNTASQLTFTDDQKNLIAAVKGSMTESGFLAVWPLDKHGRLASNYTRVSVPTKAVAPFSLTPIHDASGYLVADPAVGFEIFDFTHGINSKSPRTVAIPIDGQIAACWSAYSSALDTYYVVDAGTGIISEVKVDSHLTASIISSFSAPAASGPIDSLAVSVGHDSYFYSLLAASLHIGVWRLDGAKSTTKQAFLDLSVVQKSGIPISLVQGLAVYKAKIW